MRYLKVVAQDRAGTGRADCVLLHFYEQGSASDEELLLNRAYVLDIDADGKFDAKIGDANNDGKRDEIDRHLLQTVADTYLQFNWLNPGSEWTRHLRVYAEDYHHDGTTNCVNLQLYDGAKVTAWHAVFDLNNDGKVERTTHGDVNRDRRTDEADQALVLVLAQTFMRFNWT